MLRETIKRTRMYSGTTQASMAKEMFMSEAQYNRKENGQSKIELFEAKKMARLLELNENLIKKYWMADKIYEIMKDDRQLFYDALEIVDAHFDNYETCVELPSKNSSYSSLEERLQRRGRKKKKK